MTEIAGLVDRYQAWLKEKTTIRQLGDWAEITTPFLDRHNDTIQLYARERNGAFELTDDGYTLRDLELSGCKVEGRKPRAFLTMTLNGFGIKQNGDVLVVQATAETFAQRKHNMIQAILAINDLFYLARPFSPSLFLEDVTAWLDLLDVRYLPRVKLPGASGFDHVFDFAIPKSKNRPERLMRAINVPSRDAAEALAFAWHDTHETRASNAVAYAMLNDNVRPVPAGVIDALAAYEVRSIPWSEREAAREELAA